MYPHTNASRRRGVRRREQIVALEGELARVGPTIQGALDAYECAEERLKDMEDARDSLARDYQHLAHQHGALVQKHGFLIVSLKGGYWRKLWNALLGRG